MHREILFRYMCNYSYDITKLCHHIYNTGCTLADGTWLDYGETYKKDCMTWYVTKVDMTKAASYRDCMHT